MSLSAVSTRPEPVPMQPATPRFSKSWMKVAHSVRLVFSLLLQAGLACASWPIKKLTPYSSSQKETLAHLFAKANGTDLYVQKMYYNELQEQVARLSPRANPAELLRA